MPKKEGRGRHARGGDPGARWMACVKSRSSSKLEILRIRTVRQAVLRRGGVGLDAHLRAEGGAVLGDLAGGVVVPEEKIAVLPEVLGERQNLGVEKRRDLALVICARGRGRGRAGGMDGPRATQKQRGERAIVRKYEVGHPVMTCVCVVMAGRGGGVHSAARGRHPLPMATTRRSTSAGRGTPWFSGTPDLAWKAKKEKLPMVTGE